VSPAQVVQAMTSDPSVLAGVDVDHEYGDQCWDLVELFAERGGVPKNPWAITLDTDGSAPAGYAKNAWLYFDSNPNLVQHFVQVPIGQQQAGDIAVYNGHGTYVEGHIAIWVNTTEVFEQNADPDGAMPHVYARSNTYLLGSLRMKGGAMAEPLTLPQARILAYFVLGRSDALNGNEDADLQANHVGNDIGDEINRMYSSDECKNFIAQRAAWESGSTLNAASVKTYINGHLS
jgi:hypothetical protein